VITIRTGEPADVPRLFDMLRASAADQGSPDALVVTEADLLADGFGPQPRFRTLIAEHEGETAGLALYFIIYSTWTSRYVLYLEDLYVAPKFRRRGVGRALLDELDRLAASENCHQVRWLVHRKNQSALDLYRSWGARAADDWLLMSRP
jgi:GNAT superfamily N-acetyltransferase